MPETGTNVRSINCTQCGASLDLFGGHNVQSIVCSSCGACLDGKDEYNVVSQFVKKKRRPKLPIKIGMTATIKGVEFVVIGLTRWSERDEDGVYYSVEFQLFSPTHGYAWLARDDNLQYAFMREVKDLPDPPMSTSAPAGRKFKARDMTFRVYETGEETIDYVEGEMTWVAKVGDRDRYLTAISGDHIYEISEANGEMEFAYGDYMPVKEIDEAFGLKGTLRKPTGRHPCQPPSPVGRAGRKAIWFAVISLLAMGTILWFGRGKTVFLDSYKPSQFKNEVVTKSFKVSTPNSLMRMDLYCPLDNAWTFVEISVRKGDTQYFTISKEISYYHGYSGGESWSEGSHSASAYFKLPEKGSYQLSIWGEGGTGNSGKIMQNKSVRVTIKEGVIVSRYFIIATILFLVIWFFAIKHKFSKS